MCVSVATGAPPASHTKTGESNFGAWAMEASTDKRRDESTAYPHSGDGRGGSWIGSQRQRTPCYAGC